MGELHVNMKVTLDVIQASGGPTEQDAGFEHAGWEIPYGDAESGAQVIADIQASDALWVCPVVIGEGKTGRPRPLLGALAASAVHASYAQGTPSRRV